MSVNVEMDDGDSLDEIENDGPVNVAEKDRHQQITEIAHLVVQTDAIPWNVIFAFAENYVFFERQYLCTIEHTRIRERYQFQAENPGFKLVPLSISSEFSNMRYGRSKNTSF